MQRGFLVAIALFAGAGVAAAQDFRELYRDYNHAVESGDFTRALELAREVRTAAANEFGEGEYHAVASFNLGLMERLHGDRAGATEHLAESVRLFEAVHGEDDGRLVDPLWELALLQTQGDPADAIETFRRLGRILDVWDGASPDLRIRFAFDIADAYLANADSRRADRALDTAEELIPSLAQGSELLSALLLQARAKAELTRSDLRGGRRYLEQAVEALAALLPASDERLLIARGMLVVTLERLGEGDAATSHLLALGAARTVDGGTGEDDLRPIFQVLPVYPARARNAEMAGSVLVELTVSEDGRVVDPKVLESAPGEVFVKAALDAVEKFRYAPRVVDGKAVPTPGVKYRFEFSMRS